MAQRSKSKGVVIALILLVLFVAIGRSRPVLTVPAGQRAVIFNVFTGVEQRVLGEGFRTLLPLVQYPVLFSVRERTYTMTTAQEDNLNVDPSPLRCLTADGQPATLDLTVRYRPKEVELPKLYQEFGTEAGVVETVVRPQLRALVRMVVAQYKVTQVYSDRQALEGAIADRVRAAFDACHLELLDVSLRNISFSEAFQQAVEAKQAAQQEVEKMQYLLDQAEKDKEKAVATAQGEAQAIARVAESITQNPSIVDYEYVKGLSPKVRAVIVDGSTIVNLGDLLGAKP